MTIKNILKVAHYYELKYGFNKEAANEFGGRRMSDSPRYTRDYSGERNILEDYKKSVERIKNDSTRAEVGQTAREIVERFRRSRLPPVARNEILNEELKALEQAARNARRSDDSVNEEYIPRKPRNELGDAGEGKEIEFSPSPSVSSPSVSSPSRVGDTAREIARQWMQKFRKTENKELENEVAKLNEEIASLKNS